AALPRQPRRQDPRVQPRDPRRPVPRVELDPVPAEPRPPPLQGGFGQQRGPGGIARPPDMSNLADRITRLVSEPDYKATTLKAVARRLGVGPDEYAEFRSAVKGLIKEGRLDVSKDKKLRRPNTQGTVIGVFRRTSKGFGFVRPQKSSEKSDQI